MPDPTYRKGKPVNLEAAALDALEWLRWFKPELDSRMIHDPAVLKEWQRRLNAAIKALDKHLPNKTITHEDEP